MGAKLAANIAGRKAGNYSWSPYENGARLCRRPATVRRRYSKAPEFLDLLRLVFDAAALRGFRKTFSNGETVRPVAAVRDEPTIISATPRGSANDIRRAFLLTASGRPLFPSEVSASP